MLEGETKIYSSKGKEVVPKKEVKSVPPKKGLSVGDILINENDSSRTMSIEKITGARKVTFKVDGTIVKNKPEKVDSKGYYQVYEKQRYYLPNSAPPPVSKPVAKPIPSINRSVLMSMEKGADIVEPRGNIFQNIMRFTTFADPNFQIDDILYPIEKSTALSRETDDLLKVLKSGKTLLVKDMKDGNEVRKLVQQMTLDGKVLNYIPYNRLKYTKYQNFTNFGSLKPMLKKPIMPMPSPMPSSTPTPTPTPIPTPIPSPIPSPIPTPIPSPMPSPMPSPSPPQRDDNEEYFRDGNPTPKRIVEYLLTWTRTKDALYNYFIQNSPSFVIRDDKLDNYDFTDEQKQQFFFETLNKFQDLYRSGWRGKKPPIERLNDFILEANIRDGFEVEGEEKELKKVKEPN